MVQVVNFEEILRRNSDEELGSTDLGRALSRLPKATVKGPWLGGGAIRRALIGRAQESDFDWFFASSEQKDAFVDSVKLAGGWVVSENQHNVTLKLPSVAPDPDEGTPYYSEIVVQAITTRYYASAAEVVDSFDFTICQFAYNGENIVCGDYALWDLGRMKLVPHKLTFATASMRRLLKYAAQGFTVCRGGLANFLAQVADDPRVIEAETMYID